MKDYYKILGVRKDADAFQVKKAYRRLALLFHPDVNQTREAHQQFILINEAYKTLSNASRKRKYDLSLHYGHAIAEIKEEDGKFSQDKGRKYGTAHKYKDKNDYRNYRKTGSYSKEDEKQFTRLENVLFYSLMLIGFFAIFFSIKDLIYNEWNGLGSLTGILFALSFTSLLIYTWYYFVRK